MRRAYSVLLGTVSAVTLLWAGPCLTGGEADAAQQSVAARRSAPPDTTSYSRAPARDETSLRGGAPLGADVESTDPDAAILPRIFIVDTVVSNTDRNLKNTDTWGDQETSIAINPGNRDELVTSSFAEFWGDKASIFQSLDRGRTWTKRLSVRRPPGWEPGCPCDQTYDYGRHDELSGAILAFPSDRPSGTDIVTETTREPARAAAFKYFDPPPNPPFRAQETNVNVPGSFGGADQPWLLVNRAPKPLSQDNVYVAYDNFATFPQPIDMRVAVSYGQNPPRFTEDRVVGKSVGDVNPGLRLAKYRQKGTMWALWQRHVAPGHGDSKNIDYMLNRSTDGGRSWKLNGKPLGIAIANADSMQPTPKFGTVNALLGGADHAATDPRNGDVYYVYGNRDPGTGNDRLAVRRVRADAAGDVTIGPEHFVTGQVEAAIPQVAMTDDGTLGVFYYTFDGFSGSGFPIFTAHLAVSSNLGSSFTDHRLLRFLAPATDNGDPRQRVLGDYMQMKALGSCFYGSFTGNGFAFGRPFATDDPIFFKTCSR